MVSLATLASAGDSSGPVRISIGGDDNVSTC
jgi:hypothetical protein